MLDNDGVVRDVGSVVQDIDKESVSDNGLARLLTAEVNTLPAVSRDEIQFASCIATQRCIQIGLNHDRRAAELSLEAPDAPLLLDGPPPELYGPHDEPDSQGHAVSDLGIELGVIIGRTADRVSAETAQRHIAGYCMVTAISRRSYIADVNGRVISGTSADAQIIIGPIMLTWEESSGLNDTELTLTLNGAQLQEVTPNTQRFQTPAVISAVSHQTVLVPGDLVLTGRTVTSPTPLSGRTTLRAGDRIASSGGLLGSMTTTLR